MPIAYDLPTALEIERVEQIVLPKKTASSPIFRYFPFEAKRETVLRWTQKDVFTGMQQWRGLGGRAPRVSLVGDKSYLAQPGFYGEHIPLDETELTLRRDSAVLSGQPIPLADLVAEAQDRLLDRRLTRVEYILWRLLMAGTFTVSDAQGVSGYSASYTQTTFTATVKWSSRSTATPLDDLRQLKILARGKGTNMGRQATIMLNAVTCNHMLGNTNPNDLGGKRVEGGSTLNTLAKVNEIFAGEDLPQIEVYEGYYFDDAGATQMFIADGEAVAVGPRPTGSGIGAYRYTLNMALLNGSQTGPYTTVIVQDKQVPNSIEVHDGHNGGPVLYFPGCIIKLANLV